MFRANRFFVKLLQLDSPVPARSAEEIKTEIEQNYRWNFVANSFDGFFYFFGIAFASSSTIVPLFVSKITLNPLIIGLIAMIAQSGWYIPQMFSADKIEKLDRKKPVLVNLGLITERLPVFLWPLAALLALDYPTLALVVFIIGYAGHGLGAGLVGPAWQDLLARCFPVKKRGLMLGFATFIGTAAGVVGAAVSSWILDGFDYPYNFVLLFSIAAVAIMCSWLALTLVREPLQPAQPHVHSSLPVWPRMIKVLRTDANFRAYLIARTLLILGTMGTGFVTVVAIERWGLPDAVVGLYTALLLLGQTAGNLLSGIVADRFGHKLPLVAGGICQVLAFTVAWFASSPQWVFCVFALLGLATGANFVSSMLITMEFSDPSRRPTYVGIANSACGIALALAPLLGGWIAAFGYGWLFGSSAIIGLVAVCLLQTMVSEPRHVDPVVVSVAESG